MLELVQPGHSSAEALMFTDKPYILNAQALTSSLLLSVGKQVNVSEIQRAPRFSLRMLAGISRHLPAPARPGAQHRDRRAAHRHAAGDRLSATRALGGRLLTGEVYIVSLPVSKATVASRLSLMPEYFSKELHELEAAQLIRIDKRDIHIVDVPGLAHYGVQA